MQRQIHDLGDLLITDRRFTASPFGYLTESSEPVALELPRHASTVSRDTPATSLISELDTPSAANSNT